MTIRKSRTESRVVWPFTHSEHFFDRCAIRISSTEEFDSQRNVFAVENLSEYGGSLNLDLSISIDPSELESEVNLRQQDVSVLLIVENEEARLNKVRKIWLLADLPREHSTVILPGDLSPKGIGIVLVAVLSTVRDADDSGRAWRPGSILAERRYRIVPPASASLFQVNFTDFESRGWDNRSLWRVDFRALESCDEAPPEDTVEVHLNKNLPLLYALFSATATRNPKLSPSASLVRPLVTAEILHDVCCRTLQHLAKYRGSNEDDYQSPVEVVQPGTLADRVLLALEGQAAIPPAEAIRLAAEDPETLKNRIHGMVAVGRAFSQEALDRMRQS